MIEINKIKKILKNIGIYCNRINNKYMWKCWRNRKIIENENEE